jgi:uncharacterized protein
MKQKDIEHIVQLLLIIGAINWGVRGAFNIDLIYTIFSTSPAFIQLIYIVIGLSGLFALYQMTEEKKK